MDSLHIVLRCCQVNKTTSITRPLGMTKPEVMHVAITSLSYACRYAKDYFDVEITVIEDRLGTEMSEWIARSLPGCRQLRPETAGNDASLRAAFGCVGDVPNADVVYMVEDDYYHTMDSLVLMARHLMNGMSCYVHPTDYPDYYDRDATWSGRTPIVDAFPPGHWRSSRTSTFTFAGRLRDFEVDMREMLATCDGARDAALSEILRRRGLRTPIPTLAAHMHARTLPPGQNWDNLIRNPHRPVLAGHNYADQQLVELHSHKHHHTTKSVDVGTRCDLLSEASTQLQKGETNA